MFVVLGIILSLCSCEKKPAPFSSPDKKSPVNLKETRLSIIPQGYEAGGIVFSPDGSRLIYRELWWKVESVK